MAGDWLKMTHALPEKPEVLAISRKTGLNRFEVVGRLFILWRWFDNHTTDGNAGGVTSVTLEECLFGYRSDANFVSAVVDVHWLVETKDGISVVKFDEHTSESAKERAQTAKRVAKSKSKTKGNAEGNAESVTKTVPREEKRREEKEHPPTPKGEGRFPDFWSSWPNSDRKADRKKCLEKWRRNAWDSEADSIIAHVAAMKASRKWLDGFEPAPLTYLNGERWRDGVATERVNEYAGVI
jgi:hypothetical protein